MSPEIEMRIVVAIAAVLVLFSLLLCVSALRRETTRREQRGVLWLFMTNLAFLTATLGLMGNAFLPFWVSAALVIAGAHLGIVFGYFAVRAGLGASSASRKYTGYAVMAISGQAILALWLGTIDVLVLTSSLLNGVLSLHIARRTWPLAERFGPDIAALASLPFAAIGIAYLARLPLLAMNVSATTMTVATLVITFLLAFSALQWAFALIAFRAAQLNERLEAERQRAEEANRLKSRFLANMSHELRTPLNGVLGMAQVLQEQLRAPEQLRMIETIRNSGEGLMAILNDILDLSKIEAGKMLLEQAPFRPAKVMNRITRLHKPQAEAKALRFEAYVAPELESSYLGDEHRLTQVLHNLTSNAIKFTRTGHVELCAKATPEGLHISVADTGIGMTQAQIDSAFDEFIQADVSITRRFGGTGLGMPIVKHLVAMMDGTIDIASTPGRGTRVQLTLPLPQTTELESTTPVPPHNVTPDLSELRVLVAEDNLTNQKVLAALLRATGIQLTIVGNGREALFMALEQDFDLLLFDISMPEMDGPTALRKIIAAYQEDGRKVPPAAAITANVMPEQVLSYAAEGFSTCLAKPLRKAALIDAIQTLTDVEAEPENVR